MSRALNTNTYTKLIVSKFNRIFVDCLSMLSDLIFIILLSIA